uniref:Uncharacterized protein n=1 Tax=Arundo donax TaxID=35708 RepID=A0A0A9HWI0_ARUDO
MKASPFFPLLHSFGVRDFNPILCGFLCVCNSSHEMSLACM